MKTVRFTEVVKRSGRPRIHVLWTAPEDDTEFQRARKADRVMTVISEGHTKADYGTIGFDPDGPHGQLLLFPKSLAPFDGARVVGVKFDLVEQPHTLVAGQRAQPHPKPSKAHAHRRAAPLPAPQRNRPPAMDTPAKAHEVAPEKPTRSAARPPERARQQQRRETPRHPHHALPDDDLIAEVRTALEELRRGETVAAYERLRRAVGDD